MQRWPMIILSSPRVGVVLSKWTVNRSRLISEAKVPIYIDPALAMTSISISSKASSIQIRMLGETCSASRQRPGVREKQ